MSEPSDGVVELHAQRLPGVDVLVAKDSAILWRMFHETYTLVSGQIGRERRHVRYWHRGEAHDITNDETMLLQPGELHYNIANSGPLTFRTLFIEPELFVEASRDTGTRGTPVFRSALSRDREVHAAVREAERAMADQEATLLERETALADCVGLLSERCLEAPGRTRRADGPIALRRVKALLLERCADDLRLDELAGIARMSRFHFLRSFKAHFGMPPHRFQLVVRSARARRMLLAGLSVTDVAARLGYADQSHFTRHFRSAWGVTPGAYARALANGSVIA